MCLRTKKSLASVVLAPVEVGARGEELEHLHDAPIGERDALGADLEDEALVGGEERVAEVHPPAEALAEIGELARGDHGLLRFARHLPDLVLDAALEQLAEVVGVEVVGVHAQEEAVEDRVERLVPGHLVRGREDADQRAAYHLAAARELALVEQREQGVEDRAVRLEDLVEEDDLRLGQHAGRVAAVDALAERGDVDRAEDLVRLGEAREQVLEVVRLHQLGERADERALGRAGRAEQHAVLAGDDRDHQEPDDLVLAEELPFEGARELLQALVQGRSHRARCVPRKHEGRRAFGGRPSCYIRALERETGFEPATSTLARLHSTTELLPQWCYQKYYQKRRYHKDCGAGDGI